MGVPYYIGDPNRDGNGGTNPHDGLYGKTSLARIESPGDAGFFNVTPTHQKSRDPSRDVGNEAVSNLSIWASTLKLGRTSGYSGSGWECMCRRA